MTVFEAYRQGLCNKPFDKESAVQPRALDDHPAVKRQKYEKALSGQESLWDKFLVNYAEKPNAVLNPIFYKLRYDIFNQDVSNESKDKRMKDQWENSQDAKKVYRQRVRGQ